MKKSAIALLLIVSVLCLSLLTACGDKAGDSSSYSDGDPITVDTDAYKPTEEDYSYEYDESKAKSIVFSDTSVSGNGVQIKNTTATIASAGDYILSGSCSNGQVIVDGKGEVRLILQGLTLTSKESAAVFIKNAEKVTVVLAEGTENTLSDSASTVLDANGEPTAALFSKEDLIINGLGTLTVNGKYNNAIQSKDSLFILNTSISVTSVDDGIIGKDGLYIENSTVTAVVDGDGLRSTNSEDASLGMLIIDGGEYSLTCGTDGIQSANGLAIKDGSFAIKTGGGSSNSSSSSTGWGSWGSGVSSSTSAKGLKASVSITVEKGSFDIDSSDDAVHSNNSIVIAGGVFSISSGDDGIHADTVIKIDGGEIDIARCYEGIEAATITINAGTISIVASDDGINVAGGTDSSSTNGRPGMGGFNQNTSLYNAYINGGTIYINSSGDGFDSNGNVTVTGGTMIIDGPTSGADAAIDYDGTFSVTGGFIIAVGSSQMAQTPVSSNVYIMAFSYRGTSSGLIYVTDSDGDAVLVYSPAKSYQSVVLVSAELKKDTYNIHYGGTASGSSHKGLYENSASVAGATLSGTMTISSYTTSASSQGSPGGGR